METVETKICGGCEQALPANAFFKSARGRQGLDNHCKECSRRAKARRYFQMKKDSPTYREYRRKQTLNQYGISPAEYAALLHEQMGVCAVCKELNADGKSLCVDHDHETGQIRGLLCKPCNLALGNANDSPERLEALAVYLRSRVS